MNKHEMFFNSICEEQTYLAERELSSFITALAELYGPEQATLSENDWFDELELMGISQSSTSRDWRAVTFAASVRLADRLSIIPRHERKPAASTDTTVNP